MSLLIAYDIAENDRRSRIVKILLDYGPRIQESVFWIDIDEELRKRMETRLRKVVDEREDVLWVVPVCARCASQMSLMGTTKKPGRVPFWVV